VSFVFQHNFISGVISNESIVELLSEVKAEVYLEEEDLDDVMDDVLSVIIHDVRSRYLTFNLLMVMVVSALLPDGSTFKLYCTVYRGSRSVPSANKIILFCVCFLEELPV